VQYYCRHHLLQQETSSETKEKETSKEEQKWHPLECDHMT
jgi:hypothetical protein